MKAVVFIAVVSIIVNKVKAVEPKQLNLALETVLQFDEKDRAADLDVLDKVQDILDKIKNAMQTSGRRSSGNDLKFTDFILKAAKILKSLKDDVLEEAYIIINDESRRYIKTDTELFNDNDMRRYVSQKLDDNKEMTAHDLRRHIDAVITLIGHKREAGENSDLFQIGNTLYKSASAKLRKALSDLNKLRRGKEYNTGSLLRRVLGSLALKHYDSLGDDVKTQFIKLVKNYWRTYIESNGPNGLRSYVTTTKRTSNRWKTNINPFSLLSSFHSQLGANGKLQSNQNSSSSQSSRIFPSEAKHKPQSNQHSFSSMLIPSQVKNKPHVRQKQRHSNIHKKNLQTSKQEATESAESEEKVLMGGQNIRDTEFRAEITSNEVSRDREEDETSTEEILIQHSNVIDVGLSRKTPGRLNITFVSPENFRISDERRILRKSNANDTFGVDINPGNFDVVDKMIKHIEEEIEAVKDQFEYVKNLTYSKRIENTDSNRTENFTDAEALESKNMFSFRTQYDADSSNSTETETNRNKTNENVTETTLTNVSDITIAYEEKEITHEEHTSENPKNNIVDIDKSQNGESVEVNDTHYVNEDNHRQNETSMSPNEKKRLKIALQIKH